MINIPINKGNFVSYENKKGSISTIQYLPRKELDSNKNLVSNMKISS